MKKTILFIIIISTFSLVKAQIFQTKGDLSVGVNSTTLPGTGYGSKLFLRGLNDTGSTDDLWMVRYTNPADITEFRLNIGDNNQGDDKFVVGNILTSDQQWHPHFSVLNNGNIGIGTSAPQYLLDVKGTIRATEVRVESIDKFADFVFEKGYQLPSLPEVNNYIRVNRHLPDIPSATEVKENGLSLVDMQVKLLQKIEELTLYVIEQDKKIKELEKRISYNP